jgi:hypothetical protein
MKRNGYIYWEESLLTYLFIYLFYVKQEEYIVRLNIIQKKDSTTNMTPSPNDESLRFSLEKKKKDPPCEVPRPVPNSYPSPKNQTI